MALDVSGLGDLSDTFCKFQANMLSIGLNFQIGKS